MATNEEIRDATVQFAAVLLTQHLLEGAETPKVLANMALEHAEAVFELLDEHYSVEKK